MTASVMISFGGLLSEYLPCYLVGLHISDIGKVVSSLLQSLSSLLLLFKMPSASCDAICCPCFHVHHCSSHHCIAGSICATSLEILQQNLPGAQAESSWYPSSCGTPLQERIAEANWIAALEASLLWNHYLGQKNTTPSLKNNKAIWDKFITCTQTFTCCQRRAWCFTCICKSFIWISHCQE